MKSRVLIAIEEFAKASPVAKEMLEDAGFEIIWNESGSPLNFTKDGELYEQADYVIAGLEPYPSSFFEQFKNINAISRIGVGVDAIDVSSATEHNVKIFITSDRPSVAVAELCVSNMIALLRSSFEMSMSLKNGIWNPIQGKDLRSCTVGIVGLGSIGKEVVRRVQPFGSRIIAYSRTWDDDFATEYDVERKTINQVFDQCNVITIHLPLTEETKGMISKDLIDSLHEGSVLLNTSRAGVLDNQALADAIHEHRVQGAAIDVFDEERDPHPYGDLERVILTPHIGSHTVETRKAMEEMAVKNLLTYSSLTNANDPAETREILAYIDKHSVN